MAAAQPVASSYLNPSGSTTSAGSSGGAPVSSKRKRRLHDLSPDEVQSLNISSLDVEAVFMVDSFYRLEGKVSTIFCLLSLWISLELGF